nr:hypothetical protein [Tanacetum cinerariifolium]
MGYENLSTTSKMESDEIIKSSVEKLVPSKVSTKDIEYIEASHPDSELVSLEEENDGYQEEKEFDLENILQIQDVILREKLLSINRLIADVEFLNDNSTPDRVLKSSFTFPIFDKSDNSLSYSDNSLPEFDTFSDHTEDTRSGSTTAHANNSLLEYDSFCFEIEPDQGRNESSNFDHHDDPLFPRPPLEPSDVEVFFDFEPNSEELIAAVINNIDELIEDECFNPGGACKRFNMMPPPKANPLNQFVLTRNLYETNKKIECLATAVVIAEGKHNMSIIEGTYDKNAPDLVPMVRVEGGNAELFSEDTRLRPREHVRLKRQIRDIYRIIAIEDLMRQPFFWNAPRRFDFFTDLSNHLTEENPTTALQTDIEAIIYDVVDSKSVLSNGRPSWHSKFKTLVNSMAKILNTNKKAGWKYDDSKISSLIRLERNERSHCEETRAKAAITINMIDGDYIVKGRELGTSDTEMEQKFWTKFPKLLTKLHDAARTHPIGILKKYYH